MEVAVLVSPSLLSLMLSVDVKQHRNENDTWIVTTLQITRLIKSEILQQRRASDHMHLFLSHWTCHGVCPVSRRNHARGQYSFLCDLCSHACAKINDHDQPCVRSIGAHMALCVSFRTFLPKFHLPLTFQAPLPASLSGRMS